MLFFLTFSTPTLVFLQHGQQLYRHIYLGCKEEDNIHKNFELLFTTLAILTIELANEEVVIDLIRLTIALQVKPMHSSFTLAVLQGISGSQIFLFLSNLQLSKVLFLNVLQL